MIFAGFPRRVPKGFFTRFSERLPERFLKLSAFLVAVVYISMSYGGVRVTCNFVGRRPRKFRHLMVTSAQISSSRSESLRESLREPLRLQETSEETAYRIR